MHIRQLLPMGFAVLLFFGAAALHAQSYRSSVNDGNEAYRQQQYDAALKRYNQASKKDGERMESRFNSGNVHYRNGDVKSALKSYEEAGKRAASKEQLAATLYNAGNVFLDAAEKGGDNPMLQQAGNNDARALQMEGYKQAIELYKKTLKLQPGDADARYNLTYARKKLEELQQQQQNQNQDQKQQQQKQDKQQDQQKQDKSKQQEQQKQDKKDQQQQQQQNQKDQQQKQQAKPQQQKQPQMSKQQAEQILRALERQEKDLQKKKREEVPARISVDKDW
ncbi:MAG TPA: tetratricopeptide repeat protein [Bacteroidota bacterium]|nr:tetratricopeptide repeat protein [Bacteroidota bacterium]